MDNVCKICDHKFSTKYSLARHLKSKKSCDKNTNNIIEFKCDICRKNFTTKQILQRHQNKKLPCIPYIEKLEEENKQLKKQITNNTTNNINTTNNNQKITNNNIYINTSNEALIYDNLNTFNYKQISKIIEHVKVDNNEQIQLLNIDEQHSKDFILDNTEEIAELFKILYTNFKYKPCIIFRLDKDNFNDIYVKTDINEISELDNSKLIFIIYESFNILVKNYGDNINPLLKKYYVSFLKEYNNGLFSDLTNNYVKKFLVDLKNKLKLNLTELYEDLTLLYKNNIKKLNDKDIKFTNYLKDKNKKLIESKIVYKKSNIKTSNTIHLNSLNEFFNNIKNNDILILNNLYVYSDEFYILSIIEFFMNEYYFKYKDYASIKYEKNILYEYNSEKEWVILNENILFDNMLEDLKIKQIYFNYDNNEFEFDNSNTFNYDDFICTISQTKISLGLKLIFHYLLRYKTFTKQNIKNSIVKI